MSNCDAIPPTSVSVAEFRACAIPDPAGALYDPFGAAFFLTSGVTQIDRPADVCPGPGQFTRHLSLRHCAFVAEEHHGNGNLFGRFDVDWLVDVVNGPPDSECGPTVTNSVISGSMTVRGFANNVDERLTFNALSLDMTIDLSIPPFCSSEIVTTTFNGALRMGDGATLDGVDINFRDLEVAIDSTPRYFGLPDRYDVHGRIAANCLGNDLLLTTIESLEVSPIASCPDSGWLRVTATDGTRTDFHFRPGGAIDIDDRADGGIDRHIASCASPGLLSCTAAASGDREQTSLFRVEP